jgi:hypothetical protein
VHIEETGRTPVMIHFASDAVERLSAVVLRPSCTLKVSDSAYILDVSRSKKLYLHSYCKSYYFFGLLNNLSFNRTYS